MLQIFFGIRWDVKEIKGRWNKEEQNIRGTGSFTVKRPVEHDDTELGQFIEHSAAQTTKKQTIISIQMRHNVFQN